jgi:predicted N-acyltransferase
MKQVFDGVKLVVKICVKINDINSQDWNDLTSDDYPFLKHEFLNALEINDCASAKFGWKPCHIAIYNDEKLVGALPLYLKTNTYGEFVFDQTIEKFYNQNGVKYFPKLVSSIPYTPASGQRFLSVEESKNEIYNLLLTTAKNLANKIGASGFNCLFLQEKEQEFLSKNNLLTRFDCQYHWQNNNYNNFDDFLQVLKKKKRKNIRSERKSIKNNGIDFRVLSGGEINKKDLIDFSKFYKSTFDEKFGMATLNQAFFTQIRDEMPDNIVLIMADKNGECIAGALCYKSSTTLYGRHWGCSEEVDFLHFETCYYQGIEYCIKHNLQTFEPGAGGQYKLTRGFNPVITKSSHLLFDERFVPAVKDFTIRERISIVKYKNDLQDKLAYN